MVLLDNSGSMYDSLYTAKDACRHLMGEMLDLSLHRVGFITFETRVLLRCPLTQNRRDLLAAVDEVSTGCSTNMTGAFVKAGRQLLDVQKLRLVIIVTDGMPDDPHTASRGSERLKNQGIKIAAIGVGDIDHAYLSTLASTSQDYYQLSDMESLAATFQNIVQGLKRC